MEFYAIKSVIMKQLFTLCLFIIGINAYGQNMLSNGFGFMAAINGTTYQKTSNIGAQNFQFVCSSRDGAKFYTVNFNTSKIFILNSATYAFTDSFPASSTAYYITSANDNNMLFARGNKAILLFNPNTKSLTDTLLIGNPFIHTERPGAQEVWVCGDSLIYVVNYSSSLSLTGTIKTTNNQYDNSEAIFTQKGSTAYKSASSKKKIFKIDASTRTIIDSIDTAPYSFQSMAMSPDSSKIYGCSQNRVYVIDAVAKTVVDSTMTSNKLIMRVYHHPTRDEIWAVHHFNDSVTVFNTSTKATSASFGIGPSPFYLAFANVSSAITNTNKSEYALQVFPNPAMQSVTVSMPESKQHDIQVYNTIGQRIAAFSTTIREYNIDVSRWASGNYYLSVIENNDLMKTVVFTKE
jgi:hypothetical protein